MPELSGPASAHHPLSPTDTSAPRHPANPVLTQILLFAAGIVILYFGAESLVRGAARLARSFGMSPLVVGLTVVAFGTSAPELVVSLLAALRGQPDMTVGNVIGSNISNVALILGVSALVYPVAVKAKLLSRGIPLMILATTGLALLAVDGTIGREGGVLLLAGMAFYFWFLLRSAPEELPEVEQEFDEEQRERNCCPGEESRLWNLGLVLAGLAALTLGAHLLVGAATFFALRLGLSDLVVGLTVVAIGTSLPELATSVIAAVRKHADIAVGTAVGSNTLNILGVLGITAAVEPLQVERSVLRFEMPVMFAVSVLLLPLAWTRFRLERWEGGVLLAGYTVFVIVLLQRGLSAGPL
jgi:cation:H+ antiporter